MNFLLAEICSGAYYGKLIGKLSELHHGVSGEVYAVDARTLFIKDFTYDGEGPGWYNAEPVSAINHSRKRIISPLFLFFSLVNARPPKEFVF